MIQMTVVAKTKPEKRKEFLDVMRSLQSERLKVEGIRGSTLYEDKDRTSFRLVDEWETEEDLERYRQGESFRVFLGALEVLCEKSEIKYGNIPGK